MSPIVRNIRFEIAADVPPRWHLPHPQAVTTWFDNLSVFFPLGERFFVQSVRAHQRFVSDVRLAAEVRAFCAQEGVHSREHAQYNDMLKREGYPIDALERRIDRLLRFVSRTTPKRWQLAATCALEHFTALMAKMLLGDSQLLDGAHPVMASLWKWHAAEENEHKSVAFDVYLAAGGTYAERVFVMTLATAIFWAKVFEHQCRMMHVDGTLLDASEWRALGRFLFVDPGGMQTLVKPYLAYYRPGFHPSQIECDDLLASWRREYEAAPAAYGQRAA